MPLSADDRQARNDLAWAISVGGIGIVAFAELLVFAWSFASTLFLIFAGMLLGVALNAVTHLLGRVVAWPHSLRLAIVCLVLAGLFSGAIFLGGTTIAQQATALSDTIKSQLVNLKAFLDRNGSTPAISISPIVAGQPAGRRAHQARHTICRARARRLQRRRHRHPDLEAAAGHGQRGRQLLHRAVSRADLCGAARRLPQRVVISRAGETSRPGHRHRRRISDTLERWLIAQMITMAAVFPVTWLGLAIIGIPGSFILGIQAGCSPSSRPSARWSRASSSCWRALPRVGRGRKRVRAFPRRARAGELILTPMIQRQALDIPPATLFAFQILLGIVFGIWGISLALPLIAIVKVLIDHFKAETPHAGHAR